MSVYKTMKEWLKDVEPDQNVNGIETLDDTLRNQPRRKWFVSQEIQPTATISEYCAESGRMRRINRGVSTTNLATSVATHTLTIPAGVSWRIHFLAVRNETTATYYTFTYNPTGAGDTITATYATALNTFVAGETAGIIAQGSSLPGLACSSATIPPGLTWGPGVITILDGGFQALDVKDVTLIYEVL